MSLEERVAKTESDMDEFRVELEDIKNGRKSLKDGVGGESTRG
jgi:hypothetical protein